MKSDKIHSHVNSLFRSVSYRFVDTIVDPGDNEIGFVGINSVLLTHAHFDHIYGLNELSRLNPDVKVYTNSYGREMLLDAKKNMSYYHETPFVFERPETIVYIENGGEVCIGNGQTAKAVFTPGHNPSCITWVIDDMLFTGDSYIPGIRTVANLPDGNRKQALESVELIIDLAASRKIYAGHQCE